MYLFYFHIQGSIIVTFDIQGDLNATQEAIAQDVSNGIIVLNFGGNVLVPSSILLPDGEEVINPDEVMCKIVMMYAVSEKLALPSTRVTLDSWVTVDKFQTTKVMSLTVICTMR